MEQKYLDSIEKILRELLDKLRFEGYELELLEDDDKQDSVDKRYIKINISGEDVSELIGRYGKTLSSLEHIVNLIFNRDHEEDEYIRVLLDVNDYRKKREDYLIDVAERAIDEVRNSNLPVSLPPMLPAERRVIHNYAMKHDDIETESEGEEPERSVVIQPKK